MEADIDRYQISERAEPAPQGYTFGWQRAKLLGAFFNGVFLLALGVSILVQAIERFLDMSREYKRYMSANARP